MPNWFSWGRKPAVVVDPLQEKITQLESELARLVSESVSYGGLPGIPYPGSLAYPHLDADGFYSGSFYRNRTKRGDNPQAYLNEEQLRQARERSRTLAASNEYARNALTVRQTYIIGTGLRTTAMPRSGLETDAAAVKAAEEVQSYLEVWSAATKLGAKQKESVLRFDRDGEVFLRLVKENRRFLDCRFIEPEHVGDWGGEHTFGIKTDPDDITQVQAYIVRSDDGAEAETVKAEKVIHCKANVDSGIKRGLPFLYPIFGVLERIESVDENIAAIIKIQGAIAMLRRHVAARSSAVSSGISSRADITTSNPLTGATDYHKVYRPGTILDIDNNTEYEFPANTVNVKGSVDGKSSLLRTAAAGVGMPEYMLTSDAANGNFASTQVAESPAIANFLAWQHYWCETFGSGVYVEDADNGLTWAAIKHAIEQDELGEEVLELVTLKSEGPNIVVRDRNQETQRLSMLASSGIISRDEWAKAEGREKAAKTDEEVQAEKDREQEKQMALKPDGQKQGSDSGKGGDLDQKLDQARSDVQKLLGEGVDWDEDKHPRDGGKFASKGGTSDSGSDDKGKNEDKPAEKSIDVPKTKKAKQELAKKLQQEWLGAMKSAGLDADMPRTEEQKVHELNILNRLRNLASGRLYVGGMDNGPLSDEQYQHNHKSLMKSLEFFKQPKPGENPPV